MSKRVYICGVSGVGKSTLGQHISKEYGIPFITTSTKPLWEKWGISCHNDLIKMAIEDPQKGIDFQFELLDYRREKLGNEENFVTDRSPIDNLVYFLMQNSSFATQETTEKYIKDCNELLGIGTHTIYLKLTPDVPIENDGMRVANIHYQRTSDVVFQYAIDNCFQNQNILTIRGWDWKTRCDIVSEYMSGVIDTDRLMYGHI